MGLPRSTGLPEVTESLDSFVSFVPLLLSDEALFGRLRAPDDDLEDLRASFTAARLKMLLS